MHLALWHSPLSRKHVADSDESGDEEIKPKASPAKLARASSATSPAKIKAASTPAPARTPPKKAPSLPLPATATAAAPEPSPLEGLSFVFSGVLNAYSREAAEDLVKAHGGKVRHRERTV
jgi:NAD-dependent DNA ligase